MMKWDCSLEKLWVVEVVLNTQHLLLSFYLRKKEKEGTEVVGNIIHCKNEKSRLTVEHKMVDVMLKYEQGLDRYYGSN